MADLETDYLVVGAGVGGIGFTDVLAPRTDAEILIVDKRHHPGGHWNDAYPFVQLHQPAGVFGVDSMPFFDDVIDDRGPNAGYYRLASAAEIVAYYGEALRRLEATGKVRFLGGTEYLGVEGDEHVLRNVVSGRVTRVAVRRRLVDTTYIEGSIPSRHTPAFGVDTDAHVVPPNDLVKLADVPSGVTVFGAGKTSMDACNWLLDQGVDPNAIRWVRPNDVWVLRRRITQPRNLMGAGFMKLQAVWIKSAAEAEDARDLGYRMEAGELLDRIDTSVEPGAFRGATVSERELAALRSIENVVRMGRVVHVGSSAVKLEGGELSSAPGHLYVDCTATGLGDPPVRPIWEPGRITAQLVTLGNIPFSSATLGAAEALVEDDATKNAMCGPLGGFGPPRSVALSASRFLQTMPNRLMHPEMSAWLDQCRLNAANVPAELAGDAEVAENLTTMLSNLGGAMENLARIVGE